MPLQIFPIKPNSALQARRLRYFDIPFFAVPNRRFASNGVPDFFIKICSSEIGNRLRRQAPRANRNVMIVLRLLNGDFGAFTPTPLRQNGVGHVQAFRSDLDNDFAHILSNCLSFSTRF
jgi:hypothetical protein